jgi:hypothetical protein
VGAAVGVTVAKYERKIKLANNRIDSLQGMTAGNQASIEDLQAELDSFITWTENWINMLKTAHEQARYYLTVKGCPYTLPWE